MGRDRASRQHGATAVGRYLLVVLAEALDGCYLVVTVREMTGSERRTSRRKGR